MNLGTSNNEASSLMSVLNNINFKPYSIKVGLEIAGNWLDCNNMTDVFGNLFFTKPTTTQESALKASVTHELAKAKQPSSDGELIKRCSIEMAKAFGDDNLVKNFEAVSLSRRTM